jgi:hypothetical protein
MEVFASFVPLIVITLGLVAYAWPMIKRKGLSNGHLLWMLIPVVGYFALIWIASKPDKAILDEIAALKAKIAA